MKKTFLISALAMIFICAKGQEPITDEEAFLYFLKVYDFKAEDKSGNAEQNNPTWIEIYLKTFNANNYKLAKNDEFKRHSLIESTSKNLNDRIQSAHFHIVGTPQ